MQKNTFTILTAMVLAILLAGCGSSGGGGAVLPFPPPTPATLSSIAVSPAGSSIAPGTTTQFKVFGSYSDGSSQNLTSLATWTSSDTGIASVTAHGGMATAGTATGNAVITAKYGGKTGAATLTTSELSSLLINPPAPSTLAPNMTQQFEAMGTLVNTVVQNLTSFALWNSSDPGTATVTAAGLATALTATGSTEISATYSGITNTVTLHTSPVLAIVTSPSLTSIVDGTSQQFQALGTLTDGTLHNLTSLATWSSSNSAIASISNTAGTKGLVTSHATGTVFITAVFNSVVSSPASKLVIAPATLTSIVTSPSSTSTALGNDMQYTAIGTFTNGSTQDITASVTWRSSNLGVALISNVAGSKGLALSRSVGTTTITASSSGVTSDGATLTVTPKKLVSIAVTPVSAHLICPFGEVQFKATGTYTDGTTLDLTDTATWDSLDTTIITVVNKGLVTVSNCGGAGGSSSITAAMSGITSNAATMTAAFY